MKATTLAVAAIATAIGLAAPAHADPDTDFDHQLNTYGIYGPHDYNPYLAKVACHRLAQGVDPDAAASARFLSHNLPRGTTQVQQYQFLGTADHHLLPRSGLQAAKHPRGLSRGPSRHAASISRRRPRQQLRRASACVDGSRPTFRSGGGCAVRLGCLDRNGVLGGRQVVGFGPQCLGASDSWPQLVLRPHRYRCLRSRLRPRPLHLRSHRLLRLIGLGVSAFLRLPRRRLSFLGFGGFGGRGGSSATNDR